MSRKRAVVSLGHDALGYTTGAQRDAVQVTARALAAMAGFADFATVSGERENPTRPERIYRACGFQGDDVWHILR